MQFPNFPLPKIAFHRWRIFLLAGIPTFLVFVIGYWIQPLRYEVFGRYMPRQSELSQEKEQSPSLLSLRSEVVAKVRSWFFSGHQKLPPQAAYIIHDELLQTVISRLNLRTQEGAFVTPASLRNRLQLSLQREDKTVRISMHNSDTAIALQLIDGLMGEYVDHFSVETKSEISSFTKNIQRHLQDAETSIQVAQQVLADANSDEFREGSVLLESQTEAQSLASPSMRRIVQQQLSAFDVDRAILRQGVPIVSKSQQLLLQKVLELSHARRELLSQIRIILDQPRSSGRSSTLWRELRRQVLSLERELQLAQTSYQDFLDDKQTSNTGELNLNNVRIISAAQVASEGTRPFFQWFLVGGILSSLSVGVLAAQAREYKAQSVKFLVDIYKGSQLPVCGVIPHFSNQSLSIQSFARQENTELRDFDRVMSSYQLSIQQLTQAVGAQLPQVLVFTSIKPGAGKGLTVSNFAYLIARSGKRTLLLDANLFRASQSRYWPQQNQLGLCDCITGHASWVQAIQTIHPNLDVLHSGETDLNKDALLNSPGMALLIQELKSQYDHILVDAPTLSHSIYGYLLANTADITLLTLRLDQLDRYKNSSHLRDTLSRSRAQQWGIIINGVPTLPSTSSVVKLMEDSQRHATLKAQDAQNAVGFEISTLSAINVPEDSQELEDFIYSDLITLERQRLKRKGDEFPHLKSDELKQRIDRLWHQWSHNIEFLLEQEEEVLQQSRLIQDLQSQVKQSNSARDVSHRLQLKSEQDKLEILADSYMGQRPNLIKVQEELRHCLELLFARTHMKEQIHMKE